MAIAKKKGRPKRKSIEDFVTQLREAIIAGALMPNERLIEVDLSKTLDTNRANIRTVLAVLEKEGLVTREPNRGARVRLISDREAFEISETRQALEVLVARHAAERASTDDRDELRTILAGMEKAFEGEDLKAYSVQNSKLHETIRRIADNQTLTKLLQGLRFHFVRIQYQALFRPGRVAKSMKEHRQIVQAICSGDADRAGEAMYRHLESIKESIEWYKKTAIDDSRSSIWDELRNGSRAK